MYSGRGRGVRRGRGGRRGEKDVALSAVGGAKKQARGGKKGGSKKAPDAPKPTQEELDRQMDEYMFKDKPIAKKKLDSDLDSYFEAKKQETGTKESTEATEAAQE
eukprot:jgi/Pico_ML_1/54982/g110.t1